MAKGRVRILADEDISGRLVDCLNVVGIRSIRRFDNQFPYGTPDEVWVPAASERGFVCLSCDRKMLRSPRISAFLTKQTARVIFLPSYCARARLRDMLFWLLRHWDRIESCAEQLRAGEVVKISTTGKIAPVVDLSMITAEEPAIGVGYSSQPDVVLTMPPKPA